jgi:RNA:NAD 2'-phosphotransferase (TPT1/KptA family)
MENQKVRLSKFLSLVLRHRPALIGLVLDDAGWARVDGLRKGRRHDVHLSTEPETAIKVGARHGKPVVLVIHSGRMHEDGYELNCSANGVW